MQPKLKLFKVDSFLIVSVRLALQAVYKLYNTERKCWEEDISQWRALERE